MPMQDKNMELPEESSIQIYLTITFSNTIAIYACQRKAGFFASSSVVLTQRKRDLPMKNSFLITSKLPSSH